MQDAVVEVLAPAGGEPGPVLAGRDAIAGQGGQCLADTRERYAEPLAHPDERDAAQGFAGVPPLIAAGALAGDQAFSFVEVQGRYGNAASDGHVARREFVDQLHDLNHS